VSGVNYYFDKSDTSNKQQTRSMTNEQTYKHHIFAPTAGIRHSIYPNLCMVVEDFRDQSQRCQSFFSPKHCFS